MRDKQQRELPVHMALDSSPDSPELQSRAVWIFLFPLLFGIPSKNYQYTLKTWRAHPQAMKDIPKNMFDIVLCSVPQRSVKVSPRASNTNKHKGLMATLLRNIHTLQEVLQ